MAKNKIDNDIVTFLNSAGETVSNDPRWLARQTLESYGVGQKAEDFDVPGEYDDLEGPELKALAKERGISTKGFRRASQFREALEAWDEEQEMNSSGDSDSDSNESDDDSGNDNSSSDSGSTEE